MMKATEEASTEAERPESESRALEQRLSDSPLADLAA